MKGEEPSRGADSRVGLILSSQIDNRGIKIIILSGESLLKAREEGKRRKEGIF